MNLVEWSKNPDYPMSFTTCRVCGQEGLMKQAWDFRGSLCIDAKACLHRSSRKPIVTVGDFDHPITNITHEMLIEENQPTPVITPERTFIGAVEGLQYFDCEKCNVSWSRPSTRGRPPKVCPDCRG